MPSPVETTLHTLLPTTNLIPPQLIALANSLLAQSKHAATTLKPDEEIGRIYACCHIACQRLVNKLGLDLGKINPPCAPRVYKKLHGFLDNVLTAGKTARPASPVAKVRQSDNDQRKRKSVPVAVAHTPSAARIVPVKAAKSKDSEKTTQSVPDHAVQLGRHLCQVTNAPSLIPHLYAGLELVYGEIEITEPSAEVDTPNKRARKQTVKAEMLTKGSKLKIEAEKVPIMILTIFEVALGRLRGAEINSTDGEEIFGELISQLRDQDDILAEKVYNDQYKVVEEDIEQMKRRLAILTFWQGWIENIPMVQATMAADDLPEQQDEHADLQAFARTPLWRGLKRSDNDGEDDIPGAAGLLPGLGTMFQPAVDWLSEERLEQYSQWKENIMEQIAEIEHAH